MNKENNSSRKEFAKSQFKSGIEFQEKGKYAEAQQAYESIQREDDKKIFAMSRVKLGTLFEEQEKYLEAEQAYKLIQREDDKKIFASSRLDLMQILLDNGNRYLEAEQACQEINREDDKELFVRSRLILALLLENRGEWAKAENAYQEIKEDDDKELFLKSRVSLGKVLETQEKYQEAEQAYKKIKREDNIQLFAESRFCLGRILETQEKYQEAENAYQEIKEDDDKELFLKSRVSLGEVLEAQEKYQEAEQAYKKIKREDDIQLFAESRFNLGLLLGKQRKFYQAKKYFLDVARNDFPEYFSYNYINFGTFLAKHNQFDYAIELLEKITECDGEYFFIAKFIIGEIYIYQGEYSRALKYFECTKSFYHYESECLIRILGLSDYKVIKYLISLKKAIDNILNRLKLDNKYEEFICHYTRPTTAFSLLGCSGDNKYPSNLRLSTIKNVNDPKEGKILFDYLGFPNREIDLASFISCFTFNHDSLNQFRLYGKENNQEASGVSIVFRKDFFDEYSESYNFIGHEGKELQIALPYLENNDSIKKNEIKKLPVYRCIYIDQESDYIKLAKRNEIDFYRKGMSSKDFNDYLKDIDEKTIEIKNNLNKIKNILKYIIKKTTNDELFDIVNYVLLPLRFLVKHAAFEDEQECRIFFITNLFDERIISNVKEKSMYLEYEPSVREHIKEIYLSIGAYQYEDFFIRCLRDSSKVCRSRNPFRNK